MVIHLVDSSFINLREREIGLYNVSDNDDDNDDGDDNNVALFVHRRDNGNK